eukprot:1146273-Pelagomonas_calceolata.AAC.2
MPAGLPMLDLGRLCALNAGRASYARVRKTWRLTHSMVQGRRRTAWRTISAFDALHGAGQKTQGMVQGNKSKAWCTATHAWHGA